MAKFLRRVPILLSQRCKIHAQSMRTMAVFATTPLVNSKVTERRVTVLCPPNKCTGTAMLPTYRFMSSKGLTKEDVAERVMSCLKLYDKVKPELLTAESHFMKDLGLDSLDHVEIIVAIENEFELEIPDDAAESLLTPTELIKYVCQSSGVEFQT